MTHRRATLDELLDDPMIQMVMARDRVHPNEVRLLLERARPRTAEGQVVPQPHVFAKTCRTLWSCS